MFEQAGYLLVALPPITSFLMAQQPPENDGSLTGVSLVLRDRQASTMVLAKAFVVLTCLSLLAADAMRTWNARDIRLNEARVYASNVTRSIAQQAEDTFKEADLILSDVVERLETDGKGSANLQRLHGLLKARVAELPKLHGLFVYDADGRWIVNSQPTLNRQANNADRAYFIHHRTHDERQPYVGQPIQSRSTGEWILTLSRRFNHPDGRFAGVVLATIHMRYFNQFYETFGLGDDGVILLAHGDGALMVQRPFAEDRIGLDLTQSLLFRERLSQSPADTYLCDKTFIDGLERLISYRSVSGYPLLAAVSLSKAEVLKPWWKDAYRYFIGSALLALALGVIGFRLIQQIRARLQVEAELRLAQEKLEILNRELEKMAMQDGLTGLANRRSFDLALNEEFHRAMRNGSSLGLVMIDIDLFKQYNDAFGHPEGDECLRAISRAILSCQNRPADMVARYGGEEMAVLLPDTDLNGAVAVAERMRLAVRGLGMAHPGSPSGVVTVSCGAAALAPTRSQHIPEDLLRAADKALYLAKRSGRDHVVPAPLVT